MFIAGRAYLQINDSSEVVSHSHWPVKVSWAFMFDLVGVGGAAYEDMFSGSVLSCGRHVAAPHPAM
jgi:hypothetical protein